MAKKLQLIGPLISKVQSDLNVNDETNPAYVKNRTHWVTEGMTAVFPEQTLEFEEQDGLNITGYTSDSFPSDITKGDQLTIVFDGVEYKCILYMYTDGSLLVGNLALAFPDAPPSENGEPFIIMFMRDSSVTYVSVGTELSGSTHTLQISRVAEVVHKLDLKYIPDSIIEHENDSSIHVTTEDRSEWTNHISKTNDCIKVCTIKENFPVGTSQRYSGTYGNGKFVFAYSETSVACSTDGITWVRSYMPDSSNSWALVTYGNDKFVAVATAINPIAAYSTDGITWTETSMPNFSSQWSSVTYGNDKFVAVASGSAIAAYSTDGITWTETSMPNFSSQWSSVTYGNDKFVAVASGSAIAAYSTDGITWTETSMPDSSGGYSVAYGNGKFVATINSDPSAAAYSIDGITWTRTTIPDAYGGYSVAYGNGKFVAVANRCSAYSIDGIIWKDTIPKLKTVSGKDITEQVKEALQLV